MLGGHRGVAQLGLARLLGVQEVTGSNPVAPIFDSCAAESDRVENAVCRSNTKQSHSSVVAFPRLSIHIRDVGSCSQQKLTTRKVK